MHQLKSPYGCHRNLHIYSVAVDLTSQHDWLWKLGQTCEIVAIKNRIVLFANCHSQACSNVKSNTTNEDFYGETADTIFFLYQYTQIQHEGEAKMKTIEVVSEVYH